MKSRASILGFTLLLLNCLGAAASASTQWHVSTFIASPKANYSEVQPVISEQYIAWARAPYEKRQMRARVYNRETKQTFDLTSVFDCETDRLDITHDWIILEYRCPGTLTAIGAYNMVTEERVEISPSETDALALLPAADDNKVVWLRQTAEQDDLYLFDFESREIMQLTNDTRVETYPDISGDWVVWADFPAYDIYAQNIKTGERVAITNDQPRQNFPRIDGNLVVWNDSRDGEADIYAYDLNTRSEIPLATGPGYQEFGYPSGNFVSYLTFSYDADLNLQNSMIRAIDLTDGTDSLVYEFADDEILSSPRHHHGDMIWYYDLLDLFSENGFKRATHLINRTWLPIAFGQ